MTHEEEMLAAWEQQRPEEYERFEFVIAIEGDIDDPDDLLHIIRGHGLPDGCYAPPNLNPIIDYKGPFAIIAPYRHLSMTFDGLASIDRPRLLLAVQNGTISDEDVQRLRREKGDISVLVHGTSDSISTPEGMCHKFLGRAQEDIHAFILLRSGDGPCEALPEGNYIYGLGKQPPVTLTEKELRTQTKFFLLRHAAKEGVPIPAEHVLEASVNKALALIKAEAQRKGQYVKLNPEQAQVMKTDFQHRRRPGRNDWCPCGSGKKFKHCCINNN